MDLQAIDIPSLGQAGSYQETKVNLGMLCVLERVNRVGPPASLEKCVWYDAIVPSGTRVARHHVVFRAPGLLRSLSALSAKAGECVRDRASSQRLCSDTSESVAMHRSIQLPGRSNIRRLLELQARMISSTSRPMSSATLAATQGRLAGSLCPRRVSAFLGNR